MKVAEQSRVRLPETGGRVVRTRRQVLTGLGVGAWLLLLAVLTLGWTPLPVTEDPLIHMPGTREGGDWEGYWDESEGCGCRVVRSPVFLSAWSRILVP